MFSVAEIGGHDSAAAAAQYRENERELKRQRTQDAERGSVSKHPTQGGDTIAKDDASSSEGSDLAQKIVTSKAYTGAPTAKVAVVQSLDRPFFHIDLTSALQSAINNAEREVKGETPVAKEMEGDPAVVKEL